MGAAYSTVRISPVRVGNGLWNRWDFTRDGATVGEITETERGYVGKLFGPHGPNGRPAFTGCELPFRQSVFDQLTKQDEKRS